MAAVFWAFINMAFAAGNDFLFKCYARKPRSQGMFVAIVGIFFFTVPCLLMGALPDDWSATVIWGVISGIFSVGGNLLMLDAMRTMPAGVCSTIYRLNLVPATLGAVLLLDETLEVYQYAAIVLACIAVIGFIPCQKKGGKASAAGIIMMLIASLMRAGMGLSYKYGFTVGADENAVVAINGILWIAGGICYSFYMWKRTKGAEAFLPDKKILGYGSLSGLLVAGITLTMAKALSLGNASIVLPIMQMSFILTALLGTVILKEKLSLINIIAMLCGAAAILLLC